MEPFINQPATAAAAATATAPSPRDVVRDRTARSRTNSTSSLRSPLGVPSTPSHTPNATLHRTAFAANTLNPDHIAQGIYRIRAEQGCRSSSIPATPAPTPNPLLHVTYHIFPEQLAAGISSIQADEGLDSASFPATPAPSPFSPSPAQFVGFNPDQVAENLRRLKEETLAMAGAAAAAEQPPTPPTTTPFSGGHHQQQQQQQHHPPMNLHAHGALGIIPEHLAESIHNLRKDEGLESGSNPATPVPTPISPAPANKSHVPPEQLAAGIHRLKVEEGMSSGGSSGFPSTPAPTPFMHAHPGGVRPEELAAGISRLSVIAETTTGLRCPDIKANF